MKVVLSILFSLVVYLPLQAQLSEFRMYPNPFVGDVTIGVRSHKFYKADYTLNVFAFTGQKVIIQQGKLVIGLNSILVNTDKIVSNGVYLFQIISEGDTLIVKGVKKRIVGMNDLTKDYPITSYPNPTLNELVISGMDRNSVLKMEVFNVLGQLVYFSNSSNTETKTINLQSLEPAIYFLMITDESGNLVYRKEFQKM